MGIHSTKSLTHCLAFPTRSLPGRCILIMQVLEPFPHQIWCFSSLKGKTSKIASTDTNNSIVLCNVMGKLGLCGHTSSPISGWWEKSGKGVSQASAAQVHVLPVLPELHYPRLEDTSLVKPPPLLPPFSNHFLDSVQPPHNAPARHKNAEGSWNDSSPNDDFTIVFFTKMKTRWWTRWYVLHATFHALLPGRGILVLCTSRANPLVPVSHPLPSSLMSGPFFNCIHRCRLRKHHDSLFIKFEKTATQLIIKR